MINKLFAFPSPFLSRSKKQDIELLPVSEKTYKTLGKKLPKAEKTRAIEEGFSGKAGQIFILRDGTGRMTQLWCGIHDPLQLYDFAALADAISKSFSKDTLKDTSFSLVNDILDEDALVTACTGWGLAAYRFDLYKKAEKNDPLLIWPKGVDKKRAQAQINSICLIRGLINVPANDLGPAEIESAARKLAETYGATIKITKGKALETGFPLVHTVGMASTRDPRLIELNWGKAKDPKVTLVGKGVVFDTGGLNIKPTQYMALMKKDMGGAAHVLGTALLIMALKLPIRLRVLIPAVENAVSGNAFRPGDIIRSRKGLTVENTNTDAEGRLILADALTYGCEDKPDLIIDFATLTGSARAALGQEIPAMFSNKNDIAERLKDLSMKVEDPLWPMPLWAPYKKLIESKQADLVNSASPPGDLIYSALFLQSFTDPKVDWIHIDCFAWEPSGRPGKPYGGSDTGMRAVFKLLEERYG